MEALGFISQLYMWVLVVLLFVGIGTGILGFFNFVADKLELKNTPRSVQPVRKENDLKPAANRTIGFDNDWLRFASFSFLALLFVVTIIGFYSINKKPPQSAVQHQQHLGAVIPDYYGLPGGGAQSFNGMGRYNPYPYGTNGFTGMQQAGPGFIQGPDINFHHNYMAGPAGAVPQWNPAMPPVIDGYNGLHQFAPPY